MTETAASSASLLLDIVTTTAVVLGVMFALVQLRHARNDRRDHAAVDIVRTVQTQEVNRAVSRVLSLPDDVDPSVIRDDAALLDAALAVHSACEMWGCMVYEGVVDHQMLDRMVGGWVRGTWSRLRLWVQAERTEKRSPNVGEWWEWLNNYLEADPDPSTAAGAYVTYRGRRKT